MPHRSATLPFCLARTAVWAFAALVLAIASWGSAQAEPVKVEIGYMPILPVSQLFVSEGEGWLVEAGIEASFVQFQQGPAMVQALSAGQLDIAYFGIGPAMVARANGVDIKVVASNIVEQISFVARGQLPAFFAEASDPAAALAAFHEATGRPVRIATFPEGSVPDTVLRYWLIEQIGADLDDVEVLYMGSSQVQQALLTEAVDAASILEPVVTLVTQQLDDAEVIVAGGEMFPDQPGAVLAVREGLIEAHPELVQRLVGVHVRATEVLRNDVARAAPHVRFWVSGDRLPLETVVTAIERSRDSFQADPTAIQASTRVMHDFQRAQGILGTEVPLDELFDVRFFTDLGAR